MTLRLALDTISVSDANEGTRTVIVELARALGERPDIELVLLHGRHNESLFADVAGGARVRVPVGGGVLGRIAVDQALVPRVAARHADVLVVPSSVAAFRCALPQVVVVQHHLALPSCVAESGQRLSLAHRLYYGPVLRASLRRATAVLGNSAFVADHLVSECAIPARLVEPMPLGVRLPAAAGTRRAPRDDVLFVGTLYPYKDAEVAVRAFAEARPSLAAGARLVVVGRDPDGEQAGRLRALAVALGIGEAVRLLGRVSADELERRYADAALFVLPSRCEGYGLPVLEAMARGVPVLVAGSTSLPEVVGDAGVIVAPGDVAGFARAIAGVLTDRDLAGRLGEAGRARARRATWAAAADVVVAAAQRAVQGAAGTGCTVGGAGR